MLVTQGETRPACRPQLCVVAGLRVHTRLCLCGRWIHGWIRLHNRAVRLSFTQIMKGLCRHRFKEQPTFEVGKLEVVVV